MVTAGAAAALPLVVVLLVILTHLLLKCCCTVERKHFSDVMCVDVTNGKLGLLWLDSRSGKVIDHVDMEALDDYHSDSMDMDHRLAARLEELCMQCMFDSVPRAVTVLVAANPPDIVAARLLSGVAKFKGIMFDKNLGACDGSLQNVQVTTHTFASCVGLIAVHKEEMSIGNDEVQYHVLIDFQKHKTQTSVFSVSWESSRMCVMRMVAEAIVSDRLPSEELQRNPFLTSFIQKSFDPLMKRLGAMIDDVCSKKARVFCALIGPGADSVSLQNYLSQLRRFSIWLPTKNYHETSLAQLGSLILAASSLGKQSEGKVFLQVKTSYGVLPKFRAVLDMLAQRALAVKSMPPSTRPSYGSLYSFNENAGILPAGPPASGGSPSSNLSSHRGATTPNGSGMLRKQSGMGSASGSKRSFRSLLGSGVASKPPTERREGNSSNHSSDVSLSAMNDEEAPVLEEGEEVANPVEHDETDFQEYY